GAPIPRVPTTSQVPLRSPGSSVGGGPFMEPPTPGPLEPGGGPLVELPMPGPLEPPEPPEPPGPPPPPQSSVLGQPAGTDPTASDASNPRFKSIIDLVSMTGGCPKSGQSVSESDGRFISCVRRSSGSRGLVVLRNLRIEPQPGLSASSPLPGTWFISRRMP